MFFLDKPVVLSQISASAPASFPWRRAGRPEEGTEALAGKGVVALSSVAKKRRKKMSKHKHKKLRARDRHKKK